ncbi:MAG: D-glycero-beta-D-manno-heptose 1-phosphate adenylyltransferase [Dehalococcoidales bacterium]
MVNNKLRCVYEASPRKVILLQKLVTLRKQLTNRGNTIVLTNGCFDILHLGHIKFLQKAKYLGNMLVVGVNSDVSVAKLKGNGRPIMAQEARAEILAALSCVDYVIVFDELTAVKIVSELRPDIYVKGVDHLENDLPEAASVRQYGGEVVYVPLVEGYSTSAIIQKIKNGHS